ncbi:HAD family hydrolase [Achromobacter kerstersii]|jgi:phosphoglycolate phosphatase-like HAD superfamily hydrolase|uniref:HAD family hydrolase n=1 Tax=Achromobacter kerstersii TaxID=1353890 RepID=UPI0006C63AE3|nr:haloacid dehalogenase-like hydrolase [Achromobacter kerstersii]
MTLTLRTAQRLFAMLALLFLAGMVHAQTPLPSWNDGPSRQAIVEFVAAVTKEGGADYVAPADRIAVFDNDGTLWSEQPFYFELIFALDELKLMAPKHPEWSQEQPYKAALEGDHKTLAESGMHGLMKIVGVTHTNMTTQAFSDEVKQWVKTAQHPRFKQPYTSLTFAPMRELLDYLRGNGFKTYIVSGGEVEFMRAWAQDVYGIPPEQVIGTTVVTEYQMQDGKPVLMRTPKLDYNDDGPGKPVSINKFIGRQPIFAFGNSDGDLQMLQWTMAGPGKRFAGLVHHTDAKREWAYDRDSKIGKLDKALDEANSKGWVVVDMAREWKRVYAFEMPR